MSYSLLCWDIVIEGFSRRNELSNDIIALQQLMKNNDWQTVFADSIENSLVWESKIIIVTNLALQIVLASKNMYKMNGYQEKEVIGKSPKMFQGLATSAEPRKQMKTAIERQLPFFCDIVNYRKDGWPYNCYIEGYPVFNSKKQLVNFIALENT